MSICFLIIIFLIANSNTKDSSLTTIKLKDLTKTPFSMTDQYIIFEYENKEREFNSSINFIFYKREKPSVKAYIYDSLDKIKINGSKFEDYLLETSLDSKDYIKISYDDDYYKDNCIFYIVLYEPSRTYNDTIYVANSLKYLNFDNEIIFSSDFPISFNFLIQKDFQTYLHYQNHKILLVYSYIYINITNEKGEVLVDKNFDSVSDYIKIEPNVKYYAHIRISRDTLTDLTYGAFCLNYEKYKNNILVKDENEVKRLILSPQSYTFFKNISNVTVKESIRVNCFYNGNFGKYYIYYKKYKSDDFESLVDSFPTDKVGFDGLLGYEQGFTKFSNYIKKENDSQKGILIGFFIESARTYLPLGSGNVSLNMYKDIIEDDEKPVIRPETKSSLSIGWIIFIVISSVIIVTLVICAIMEKLKKRGRNNLIPNDMNNDYYDYDNIELKNPGGDNYNPIPANNDNDKYNNKIEPNDESTHDNNPVCPAINDN